MAKAKSKSKKKSAAKKKTKVKVNAEITTEAVDDIDAEEELTAGEKFLMASKPYWAHIALAVLAVIFASVLWSTWKGMSTEAASQPWRDLNNAMTQAGLTSDVSSLKEMATANEGKAAGNWAWLMAGDNEVNRGISMLARDRVGGLKLIKKGMESLQKVVDAPAASKSPMLQRRSTFMLAYGKEATGDFEEAKSLYQSILDLAPDSPFANVCRRGVERCSNTELAAVYDNFRNWEEATDVAPGPLVPDAPKLDLNSDDFKLPEGEPENVSGGDFGGGEMKKEDAAEAEAKPEAEKAAEPAESEKEAAVEMPKETEAEKPAETSAPETEIEKSAEAEKPAEAAAKEESASESGGEEAEAGESDK